MQRDFLFQAAFEALSSEHCAICFLSLRNVERYLDGFLYEHVNDPPTRDLLIKARGFCPVHGWQLTKFRHSTTGIAIVYRHLLEDFHTAFVERTARQAMDPSGARWLPWATSVNGDVARNIQHWLEPRAPCPACTNQWQTEDRFASTTADALSNQDFLARYESSLGLCARHLTTVMERIRRPADLDWLMRTEHQLMEQLMHELAEFWRKHDYRFQREPMSDTERICCRRVLYKLGGGPGMVWHQ